MNCVPCTMKLTKLKLQSFFDNNYRLSDNILCWILLFLIKLFFIYLHLKQFRILKSVIKHNIKDQYSKQNMNSMH